MSYKKSSGEGAAKPVAGVANLTLALVVARENKKHVEHVVRAAVNTLSDKQISESQLRMIWAPSVFHLPLLAKSIAESRDFDGVIVLGATSKDKTDRYYYESAEVYRALMDVMMNFGIPLSVGIASGESEGDMKHVAHAKDVKNPGARAAQEMIELLTS